MRVHASRYNCIRTLHTHQGCTRMLHTNVRLARWTHTAILGSNVAHRALLHLRVAYAPTLCSHMMRLHIAETTIVVPAHCTAGLARCSCHPPDACMLCMHLILLTFALVRCIHFILCLKVAHTLMRSSVALALYLHVVHPL